MLLLAAALLLQAAPGPAWADLPAEPPPLPGPPPGAADPGAASLPEALRAWLAAPSLRGLVPLAAAMVGAEPDAPPALDPLLMHPALASVAPDLRDWLGAPAPARARASPVTLALGEPACLTGEQRLAANELLQADRCYENATLVFEASVRDHRTLEVAEGANLTIRHSTLRSAAPDMAAYGLLRVRGGLVLEDSILERIVLFAEHGAPKAREANSQSIARATFRDSPAAVVTDRDNLTIRDSKFVANILGVHVLAPHDAAPALAMSNPEVVDSTFEMNAVGIFIDTDQVAGDPDPAGLYERNELRANLVGVQCYSNGWPQPGGFLARPRVAGSNLYQNWGDAVRGLRGALFPTDLGTIVVPDSRCDYDANHVGADSVFLSAQDTLTNPAAEPLVLPAPPLPFPIRIVDGAEAWSEADPEGALTGPVVVAAGGSLRITQPDLALDYPVGSAPGGRLTVQGTAFTGTGGLVLRNDLDEVRGAALAGPGALDALTVYRSSATAAANTLAGTTRERGAGIALVSGLFEDASAWAPRVEDNVVEGYKYGVLVQSQSPLLEGNTVRGAAAPDQAVLQGGLVGAALLLYAANVTSVGNTFERSVNGLSALSAILDSQGDVFDRGFAGVNSHMLNTLRFHRAVIAGYEFGATMFSLDHDLAIEGSNLTFNAIGVLPVVNSATLTGSNLVDNYLLALYPYPATRFGTPAASSVTCTACWAPSDEAWLQLYGSTVAWSSAAAPNDVPSPPWAAAVQEVAGAGNVLEVPGGTLDAPAIARDGATVSVEGVTLDLAGFPLGAKGGGLAGGPTGALRVLDATLRHPGFLAMNSTSAVVRSSSFEGLDGGASVLQVHHHAATFECNFLAMDRGSPGRVLDLQPGEVATFRLNTFEDGGDLQVGIGVGSAGGLGGDTYHRASVTLAQNTMRNGTSARGFAYLGQNGTHDLRDNILHSNLAGAGALRPLRNWTAGALNPAVVPGGLDATGTFWGDPSGPVVQFRGKFLNDTGAEGLRLTQAQGSSAWPPPTWQPFSAGAPPKAPCVLFRFAPDAPLEGSPVLFTDHSDEDPALIERRAWDFGDGSPLELGPAQPTHIYLDSGTYRATLELNLTDGRSGGSARSVVVLDAPPVPAFMAEVGDEIANVTFTDTSTHPSPGDAPPTGWTYAWDFGGLAASAERDPSFRFPDGGTYAVGMTATDGDGKAASTSQDVVVPHVAPVPGFEAAIGSEVGDVLFSDLTSHPNPADADPATWTYAWDFAALGSSAEREPAFRFAEGGTYNVSLAVTDDDGMVASTSQLLEVPHAAPVVDFAASITDEASPVLFTDLTTHPNAADSDPATWAFAWDFAGLGSSEAQHPGFQFPDGASYDVTLTVTDDDGQVAQLTRTLDVPHAAPVVDFGAEVLDEASPVKFTDLTTHPNPADQDPATWAFAWDFAGLGSSAAQHPSFQFPDGGAYDVTLTVADDDGIARTVTRTVAVGDALPFVGFAADVLDEASPVQFTDLTTHPNPTDSDPATWTFAWDFAGFSESEARHPSFQFPDGATYDVTLTVTDDDGGASSLTRSVTVPHAAPEADFGAAITHEANPVQFTDLTTHPNPADQDPLAWTFAWDFAGLGSSALRDPSFQFPDGATYDVTLAVTDNDGQASQRTRSIVVPHAAPVVDFAAAITHEANPVQFTDLTTHPNPADQDPLTWTFAWDFDGLGGSALRDPTFQFPEGGTYAVTLTVTDDDGLVAQRTRAIAVPHTFPLASFDIEVVDEASPVAFRDTTVHPNPADNDPATWTYAWDFDGLGGSAERNPSFQFPEGGTYNVTLTVTDDDGEDSVMRGSFPVPHASPAVDFASSVLDEASPVQFTDLTAHPNPADQDPATWTFAWDFGGLGSSTQRDPLFQFPEGGAYDVTLTVTDDDGQASALAQTVVVPHAAPAADFAVQVADEASPVQFSDQSTHPNPGDAPPAGWTYAWDFGGVGGSALRDPAFKFPEGGTYDVTLTVTDNDDVSHTVTLPVAVPHALPLPGFMAAITDELGPVAFTDATTHPNPADDDPATWTFLWDFAGLGSSTLRHPSFQFADGGPYAVALTVTDDDGQAATIVQEIVVPHVAPDAGFAFQAGHELEAVRFTDLTVHPNAADAAPSTWTYRWEFGGAGSSAKRSPLFRFPDGGTYDVRLTVTDDDGMQDTVVRAVQVGHVPPVAAFRPHVRAGNEVQFTDASTHPNPADAFPPGWTFAWTFGDGATSAARNPLHAYGETDVYTVTLTVTDDDGRSSSFALDVDLSDLSPVADFAWSPTTPASGQPAQFVDRSTDDAGVVDWLWDFGDGSPPARTRDPSHAFAQPGDYLVRLTVSDGLTTDTAAKVVSVCPFPARVVVGDPLQGVRVDTCLHLPA